MKTSIADILAQKDVEIEKLRNPWQPIETAPKDGRMILVCMPRMMNLIVRSRWNRVHNHWINDDGQEGLTNPAYYHAGDFWCELPQPPQTKEAKDAND